MDSCVISPQFYTLCVNKPFVISSLGWLCFRIQFGGRYGQFVAAQSILRDWLAALISAHRLPGIHLISHCDIRRRGPELFECDHKVATSAVYETGDGESMSHFVELSMSYGNNE